MGVFNNFPYANFHELNADWIIEQVRKVMDEWEEYKTDMDLWKLGVDDQLAEFQAWFDNLDVQDEVRTVMNELILSGEFIEITSPQIVSATEAWLAAHITPTTPAVDDTLSISGAAADAKVTGDRITDLKEDINNLENCLLTDTLIEFSHQYKFGSYNLSTGAYTDPYPTTQYIYAVDFDEKEFKLIDDSVTVNIANGYKYRGVILKPDGTYHGYLSEWISTSGTPAPLQNLKGYFVKPIIAKVDGTNITNVELATMGRDIFSISGTYPLAKEVHGNTEAINDITEIRSVNLLNPDDFIRNGYYLNFTDGITHVSNDYYKMTADKIHTGLINKLYVIQTYSTTSLNTFLVYCYDGDEYLGYVANNFATYGSNFEVNLIDGTTDIRIMSNNSDDALTGDMLCISTTELDEFTPYDPIHKIKENAIPQIQASVLNGKNVVFLGDSLFGNIQTASGVVNQFADLTGANVANFAFGGTQATLHAGSTPYALAWQKFDGVSIATAIANNNFSEQESALAGGAMTDAPDYFATSLSILEDYDFSKCDYIIADWGTNDWTGGSSIANYKTALQTIVRTILTAYPDIVFIECTPFIRFFNSGGTFYNSSVYDYRNDGVYLNDFAEAVAEALTVQPYNMQVVDCYNIGINNYTRTGFFSNNDWTHHDSRGRKRIAMYLANKLC